MDQPHYWFRRKRFGWGLEPGSREGWIATAAFAIITVGGDLALIASMGRAHPWIPTAWVLAWLGAFLALVVAKGEKLW
jgi:hypothetical protein